MTADERRALKALIDQAVRGKSSSTRMCAYGSCSREFVPAAPHQRFCCKTHRTAAWARRTEAGKEWRARWRQHSMDKLRGKLVVG